MPLGGLRENSFLPEEFKKRLPEQNVTWPEMSSGVQEKYVPPLKHQICFLWLDWPFNKEVLLGFLSVHEL